MQEMPQQEECDKQGLYLVWGFSALMVACVGLVFYYGWRSPAFEPVQSVPFNHVTHAAPHLGNMDCLTCHPNAQTGACAGLPSDKSCLDCHQHILASDPRLLPLHAAANVNHPAYTAEPLAWRRGNVLPAHVRFHHGRHARAGISCAECHPLEGRSSNYTMRECLDCHRQPQRKISTNCATCH